MAADAAARLVAENTEARWEVLEDVSEDCYMLVEFTDTFRRVYSDGNDADKIRSFKQALVQLLEEGLIRIHWGRQCSFPYRASEDLQIRGAEVTALSDELFVFPASEPYVCVCDTPLTRDAYDAAYRDRNGGPSA